jgi:hypothetical protein
MSCTNFATRALWSQNVAEVGLAELARNEFLSS